MTVLTRGALAALVAALVLLAPCALAETAVVDVTSTLHMRSEPCRGSLSLGSFYSGTQVEIVGDAGGGWSEVSIGEGLGSISGYMKSDYLTAGAAMDGVLDATYDMKVVSPYGTRSVVLRSKPSDSFDAVAVLEVGEAVRVIGVSGDFYYVRSDDDEIGCLAGDELK